jgi:chaperonin GroES
MADFKLQPLEDRIVVQANEGDQTTASGLVIPDTAKEKPQEGTVVAAGPGRWNEDGDGRVALDVKVGDVVIYSKYGGTEVKVDGEEYLILSARDQEQQKIAALDSGADTGDVVGQRLRRAEQFGPFAEEHLTRGRHFDRGRRRILSRRRLFAGAAGRNAQEQDAYKPEPPARASPAKCGKAAVPQQHGVYP